MAKNQKNKKVDKAASAKLDDGDAINKTSNYPKLSAFNMMSHADREATLAALAAEANPERAFIGPSKSGVPRLLIVLIGIAGCWISIEAVKALNDIIAPFFLCLNLVIVAYPLKRWLDSKKCPGMISSLAVLTVVFGVLVAFFAAIAWSITKFSFKLPEYYNRLLQFYNELSGTIYQKTGKDISKMEIYEIIKRFDPNSMVTAAGKTFTGLSSTTLILATIVLILCFLLVDINSFSDRQQVVAKQHRGFVQALTKFSLGVRRYWVVSTVFGLIVAVCDWVALEIMDIPLAAVWAVLSFVTNYIPNIGFIIGVVPPALIALLDKDPIMALAVLVVYSVLNVVIQTLIQPKFTGDAVGVTPLISFISLLVWTYVLGPLGTLLALPATLFVKVIFVDADPKLRWINAYISSEPRVSSQSGRVLSEFLSKGRCLKRKKKSKK